MAIAQVVNHCFQAPTVHNHLGQLGKQTRMQALDCASLLCAFVPANVSACRTSGVCFTTSLIRVTTFFLTYSSGSLRQDMAAGKISASITNSARLTECLLI